MSGDTKNGTGSRSNNKVLVTAATGKAGYKICLALVDAGFDVYGTTRSASTGADKLKVIGVTPVIGDYTTELSTLLVDSGAHKLLFLTDYWTAAHGNVDVEVAQGKQMVDAAIRHNVEHAVFMSVADPDNFPKECQHIPAKLQIEAYLQEHSRHLNCWSVVRPAAFFENFDDAANYNPLTKGSLKFLMTESLKWCSTYDIGRAAAVQLQNPTKWHGKTLDVIGYEGDLNDCADALETVGGFPVTRGLAVPLWLRKLVLGNDLHYMCEFFAGRRGPGIRGTVKEFQQHVPDAHDAAAWFRHHNMYANGEPIVGNAVPPSSGGVTRAAIAAVGMATVVAAVAVVVARKQY